MITAN